MNGNTGSRQDEGIIRGASDVYSMALWITYPQAISALVEI
jgi:hypothetical protein